MDVLLSETNGEYPLNELFNSSQQYGLLTQSLCGALTTKEGLILTIIEGLGTYSQHRKTSATK